MRANRFRSATLIVFVFVAVASGQTQPVERVFHFTHNETVQEFQQLTNAIRAMTEIQQASVVAESKALVLRGTPAQISMAEWMFRALDRSAGGPSPGKLEYAMPGAANELIRVFHTANTPSPQGLQEIVNAVRSVAEVQRVAVLNRTKAFVMRGSNAQLSHAEWMIDALDKPAGGGPYPSQSQTLTAPEFRLRDGSPMVTQISYPPHIATPQHLQESVNMIRAIAEIQRAVSVNAPGAIVVRAAADQVALAQWLLDALAKPPATEAPVLKAPLAGVAYGSRMIYVTHIATPQGLQDVVTLVRTQAKVQRVAAYAAARAVALRATPDQLSEAELLIRQADQSAAR